MNVSPHFRLQHKSAWMVLDGGTILLVYETLNGIAAKKLRWGLFYNTMRLPPRSSMFSVIFIMLHVCYFTLSTVSGLRPWHSGMFSLPYQVLYPLDTLTVGVPEEPHDLPRHRDHLHLKVRIYRWQRPHLSRRWVRRIRRTWECVLSTVFILCWLSHWPLCSRRRSRWVVP